MGTELLLAELGGRWRTMFRALADGEDLPPAQRLRAEGLMEAEVLLGRSSADRVLAAMDGCFREVFGRGLTQEFGEDWQDFYPFPQIPAVMRRAPVFPSTPD